MPVVNSVHYDRSAFVDEASAGAVESDMPTPRPNTGSPKNTKAPPKVNINFENLKLDLRKVNRYESGRETLREKRSVFDNMRRAKPDLNYN